LSLSCLQNRKWAVPDFRFLCEQGYQYEIRDFDQLRRKKLAEWSCLDLPFPANDGATE
jgi:hypothetical protein